jgi:DNA-binding response OmpR family regulator
MTIHMRILVIEHETDLREYLKKNLEIECFAVDTAGTGEQGSYMGRIHDYDLILLDDNLPGKSGLEVCREIRAIGKSSPIMVLSEETEVDVKINFFNLGADDFLCKPFSYKELSSRIRAILRRPARIILPTLEVDDLTLDTINQTARRGSKQIYLTRKEFALAEYLMRNSGSIVSRTSLLEHVWSDEIDPFSNTIEAHILNLRKKIDKPARKKLIHTVPGRGYVMDHAMRPKSFYI